MLRKILFGTAIACLTGMSLVSCNDDDLDPTSIFPTDESVDNLDPTSPTYQLDKYLMDNYVKTYNVKVNYKLQDIGTDFNYNLIPASYSNAVDLAVLTHYFWFEVYDDVVSPDFLKQEGPRMLHFIGSAAVNIDNTVILGLAEGGLKVSLFNVNAMNPLDIYALTDDYFHTMHHEFAHILHQTKTYPVAFEELTPQFYDPTSWADRDSRVVASQGFVTPYASSEAREDFAETIAFYITATSADSLALFDMASRGWVASGGDYIEGEDSDGVDGVSVILQKIEIARQWFRDAWNMDLDALRVDVQRRQANFNEAQLEELRNLVYGIEIPSTTGE